MKKILVALLVLLVGTLAAADLTTKSGKVYKDYSISGVSSKGVSVVHSEGITGVPVEDLPDDLRAKYADAVKNKKIAYEKYTEKRKKEAIAKAKKDAEEAKKKQEGKLTYEESEDDILRRMHHGEKLRMQHVNFQQRFQRRTR